MDDDEQFALERLEHRLTLVQAILDQADARDGMFDLAVPGTVLAEVDARLRPLQTSHVVGHCMSMALDNLRGARLLLIDPDKPRGIRLLQQAHYPMLRSAAEGGALAIWLLGAGDPEVMVARTLRARWEDVVEDDRWVIASTAAAPGDTAAETKRKAKMRQLNGQRVRAKKRRVREIAESCGVPYDDVTQGLPGWQSIVETAADAVAVDSNHVVGHWKMLSGLTHPSASRAIFASSVELFDHREDGTSKARFTARPELVTTAVEAAVMFYTEALDQAAKFGGNEEIAHRLPADFPMPPGWTRDPATGQPVQTRGA